LVPRAASASLDALCPSDDALSRDVRFSTACEAEDEGAATVGSEAGAFAENGDIGERGENSEGSKEVS
jgi:hypothetical protein